MYVRMFKKSLPRQNWRVCLIQSQNSRYFHFSVSGSKGEKFIKGKHANYIL